MFDKILMFMREMEVLMSEILNRLIELANSGPCVVMNSSAIEDHK